jgi:hypothetical protein
MDRRAFIMALVAAAGATAQQSRSVSPGDASQAEAPVEFICPMHPDVHSLQPGHCPRCGMDLVANLPDRLDYPLNLKLNPPSIRAGRELQMVFTVTDPKTGKRVTDFQVIHEKLYHLFIVSQDLQYFVHDHPEKGNDGVFRFSTTLPRPGMYRVLSDFYPQGGTPQLIVKTIVVPGAAITPGVELQPETSPKQSGNMQVSLTMQPEQPIAGMKTLMFFHLEPADGLEPYLGAWSHMLAASDDLVDMIHDHPFSADGGPTMQFNMIFPRARVYRIWVQFQRSGVVNTAVFDVPVSELK